MQATRLGLSGRTAAIAIVSALAILSLPGVPGTASATALARGGGSMTLADAPASLQTAVRRALAGQVTSTPRGWAQTKLTAPDPSFDAEFGWSVAISGSTAVVGAPFAGANSAHSFGAAYVFVQSGAGWTQVAEVTGTKQNEGFGAAVATNGSTVAVGAPGLGSGTGAVFVFMRSGGSWVQQAKLTGAPGDELGASVAISGNTLVAGAPGNSAAYVFAQSGSVWPQQGKLTASDAAAGDGFGDAVAVSGSTAVVGAQDHAGTGAAYVFTSSGGPWTQQAELTASDGASGDRFGISVAASNQTAVVGASAKAGFVGAAYVFTQSGTVWTQQAELTPATTSPVELGSSVATDGSTAAVGADAYVGNGPTYGAIFVFRQSGGSWRHMATLLASDRQSGDNLGVSVAIAGSSIIAGAPGKSGVGAAYAFSDYGVPTVTGVTPASGPVGGGNTVTIDGAHFVAGLSSVDFGGVASQSVTVISAHQIQAVAPAASSAGSVDVTVTTPGATSKPSAKDLYTYG